MSYNTCRAPVLFNYAHAKEWHDNTPPIRGNADKVRPLGSRRHWQMASISMDGDDVVLNYYGKKAVVWHPDDSLSVYKPRWCTAFEPDKMAHFLPPKVKFTWDKCRLFLVNEWVNTTEGKPESMLVPEDEPVRLTATSVSTHCGRIARQFKITNLPEVYQYRKRRGVVQRVMREKFTPFFEWVSVVTAITKVTSGEHSAAKRKLFFEASGITPKQWVTATQWYANTPWGSDENIMARKYQYSEDTRVLENFPMGGRNSYRVKSHHKAGVRRLYEMLLPENQEHWADALHLIGGHHGIRTWANADVGFNVSVEHVEQYVEKIVCIVHRDDVFERVKLETGAIPSKAHLEFFNEVGLKFFETTDNVSDISV